MLGIYSNCPCQSGKKFKFCCNQRIKNNDFAPIAQIAESLPCATCLITKGYKDAGIACIFISKIFPDGTLVLGNYLIDFYCLGVKDAYLQIMDTHQFAEFIESKGKNSFSSITYEEARGLVIGGFEYARSINIAPCKEWSSMKYFVESTKPFTTDHIFGYENGKPLYIEGPYANQEIISRMNKPKEYFDTI